MFEASFSAFNIGHATHPDQELTFSTDTSNFADAGVEGSSAAFGSFEGEGREENVPAFDTFGSAEGWGSGRAVQLQKSGAVTDDGFPTAGRAVDAPPELDDVLAALLRKEAAAEARLDS